MTLLIEMQEEIADDEINSPTYTGPVRYLHYDFSPTKSNVLYNVYDHTNTESIMVKVVFLETSVLDNARIIPRKIKRILCIQSKNIIFIVEISTPSFLLRLLMIHLPHQQYFHLKLNMI